MSTYIRLTDYKNSDSKEQGFFEPENRHEAKQDDFEKIPGSPIAYWLSNKVKNIFENSSSVQSKYIATNGMFTCNNELFLRLWQEVELNKFSISNQLEKWFPYNKGGEFRKWYGNREYLVNYKNDAEEIRQYRENSGQSIKLPGEQYFFEEFITWTDLASNGFNARYVPSGSAFDIAGSGLCQLNDDLYYILGLLNTKISTFIFGIFNSTLHYQVGDMRKFPIIFPKSASVIHTINSLTQQNVNNSKEEWDSRETSWDFTKNELIKHKSDDKIEIAFENYCNYWKEKFYQLHSNEEELNRLFIEIYDLQDELTPDVDLNDITILKQEADIVNGELVFNADEIMKQFISYAVGVMFGRYSLDQDGLIVANLNQDYPKDTTFEIDDDNVIPVLDDEYFSDDIVSRFVSFVKTTFGEESLSENIKFIEESLGKDLRKYFVKDFYDDHVKRYKKRPIYWMVSSPKKGFMSLIYMHRYTPDVFARVRNSYLIEYIAKLEAHKETLTLTVQSSTASNKDKQDADKAIKNIEAKLKEVIAFDRDAMMHYAQKSKEIDLDDGVKVNYCKFKDILFEFDKKLCK